MELEGEAIREKLLDHSLPLIPVWLSLSVGFASDVEFIRIDPFRRADDLLRMHTINERNEVRKCGVDRNKLAGPNLNRLAGAIWNAGLDGSDFKRRIRVRSHCLGWW